MQAPTHTSACMSTSEVCGTLCIPGSGYVWKMGCRELTGADGCGDSRSADLRKGVSRVGFGQGQDGPMERRAWFSGYQLCWFLTLEPSLPC